MRSMYNMQQTNALSQGFIEPRTSDFAVYAEGQPVSCPYDKQGGSEDYFKPEFQQPHRQQTDNIKKVESMKKQIKNKPPKTVAKLCTGLCLTKS